MLLTAMPLFITVNNLFITGKNLFRNDVDLEKCFGFINSTFGTVCKDGQ